MLLIMLCVGKAGIFIFSSTDGIVVSLWRMSRVILLALPVTDCVTYFLTCKMEIIISYLRKFWEEISK